MNFKYLKGVNSKLGLSRPVNRVIKLYYTVPNIESRKTLPVQLKVYDDLGEEITTHVEEEKPAGYNEVEFDVSGLKKGMYFYQVFAGSFVSVRKIILLK